MQASGLGSSQAGYGAAQGTTSTQVPRVTFRQIIA
jgi:hypothetical protein